MDALDQSFGALRGKQIELAASALQQPAGRDSFEYGRVCGLYQGLEMALNVINDILTERAARDRSL
mgnify:CR=1 FL=1